MCEILIWFWLSIDWTIFLTKLTIKYCVPRINSVFFNFSPVLAKLVMSVLSRFCLNMAANVGLQYAAELLPTPVRSQGVSFIHIFGIVAHSLAPYITDSVNKYLYYYCYYNIFEIPLRISTFNFSLIYSKRYNKRY